jgi:hypothetical protein
LPRADGASDQPDDEVADDQQQHERDGRHLDQAAGEAQRYVTGIREQEVGEERAEDCGDSDV